MVGGPQCQVVAEELHNESGVLVGVLGDIVKLSDGILECSARHLASLLWVGQHFILENGVVECETKTDRMCYSQILLCNALRISIGLASALCGFLLGIGVFVLGNVTVVISLHLLVEDLRLAVACLSDELVIQELQDGVTNLV